jgi:iron complex outermembrane receptor protein
MSIILDMPATAVVGCFRMAFRTFTATETRPAGAPRRMPLGLCARPRAWIWIAIVVALPTILTARRAGAQTGAGAGPDGGAGPTDEGGAWAASSPEAGPSAPPIASPGAVGAGWDDAGVAPEPDAGPAGEAGAPESATALASVVVTAEKREENIQQVPLSITAVSQDELRDQDIRASTDVAKLVPNMSSATSEGRSRPRWFIRGIGINDPSTNGVSPIGVYFDEVYENFTLAQSFPLFDLERVEVLRGPQGTLWGKNTTGGAISFISRKPSFEYDGYTQATAGDYGEFGVQGAGGGAVIKDRIAARASFFYESRNGWVTNVYNNTPQGSLRDAAGRLQVLLIPVDKLEITLSAHVRHNDGQSQATYIVAQNGGPVPGLNGFKEGSRFYTYDINGPATDVDNHEGGLANIRWELGPGATLTSISAYDDASRTTAGGTGPLEQSDGYAYAHAKQFTQELRLAPTQVDRLSWVVGGHYFREGLFSNTAAATLPAIPQPVGYGTYYSDTAFIQTSQSFAGFANATYDFIEWFRLALGARWTTETKDINLGAVNTGARGAAVWNNVGDWWLRQSVQTPLHVSATQVDSRTWSSPSFDASPSFNISKDLMAYFHYGHGFRGGTYYGGVNAQSNVSVVGPETVDAFEVGAKAKTLSDRLSATIAGFHYAYHDIQVLVNAQTASNTVSATILQNAGGGTVNGAEIEAEAIPVDNLRLHGNLGLLETRYDGFTAVNNNEVVNASGNQFTRSPHVTALVDAQYRILLPGSTSLVPGTDWEYTSHFFFNAVDQQNPNLQQNGYVLGNARLSFFTWHDALELQLWIHNITNEAYKILATQGVPGVQSWVFGPPRMFGATATAKF